MATTTPNNTIVFYNDGAVNHTIRPQWDTTKVAPQPCNGGLKLVCDPFAKTCWLVSRSGQLIHDGRLLSPLEYKAIWAEQNFGN